MSLGVRKAGVETMVRGGKGRGRGLDREKTVKGERAGLRKQGRGRDRENKGEEERERVCVRGCRIDIGKRLARKMSINTDHRVVAPRLSAVLVFLRLGAGRGPPFMGKLFCSCILMLAGGWDRVSERGELFRT